jgi:hypothetical protein
MNNQQNVSTNDWALDFEVSKYQMHHISQVFKGIEIVQGDCIFIMHCTKMECSKFLHISLELKSIGASCTFTLPLTVSVRSGFMIARNDTFDDWLGGNFKIARPITFRKVDESINVPEMHIRFDELASTQYHNMNIDTVRFVGWISIA